ncbi:aminotransferase class III-fold pyridoxal phosphate-dependent enzyme [Parvularcula marina]|nr:aminotransferase class III-fold pyridoxal phosphate-dependent enzyme [Parvularcula marina]
MSAITIERCRQIAADLSGMEPGDLSPEASFLSLGFDSLFLTQLAAAYTREFGTKVTFRQLIDQAPTMVELSKVLPEPKPAAPAPVPTPEPAKPATVTAVAKSRPVMTAFPAAEGMAGVFQQQLALMQEQLRLLTGEEAAFDLVEIAPEVTATAPVIEAAADEPYEKPALPKGFGPSLVEGDRLSPAQEDHLARLIARYNEKTKGSKAATQADRPYHADPRTAAGFDRRWKDLVYPLVINRSEGAYLWDVDGNRYIDMLNGFGPNFFGHNAPFVREALRAQLEDGFELGPQTPRAGEAAKLLCELTGMDRASWVNTGSEAVQAAIRISRTVTAKNKIVVFEGSYHGNFDEVLVRRTGKGLGRTIPLAPGIPFESVGNVIVLPYGTDETLEVIRQEADDIAAVLVEPIQSRRPEFQPLEFLHQLRDLTREQEIVLVFDEVITGFRTGPGGAQEYYGVEADLATFGKVLGGGMPIGAVAGRKGVMDTFDGGFWQYGDESVPGAGVTFFAGTFVRHPLAMAAAYASLNYLKSAGSALQNGINQNAERFQNGLNDLFSDLEVPFHLVRFGSQMFLRTGDAGPLASLFFYHLRDRGVHLLEGFPCYMTAAHTEEDVDFVIEAAREALSDMIGDGVIAGKMMPRDLTYEPSPAQTEIWVAAQLDPASHLAFNESDTFTFHGADFTQLADAVRAAISEPEAFRTTFDGDGALAHVTAEAHLDLQILDHRHLPEEECLEKRELIFTAEADTPFDLEDGPLIRPTLIRETDERAVLILYAHHIIFDGWSAEQLLEDIAAHYRGEVPERSQPFSAYAAKVADASDLDWWAEKWKEGVPSLIKWPGAIIDPSGATGAQTANRSVDAGMMRVSRALASGLSVSPSAIWLATYGLGLADMTGMRDFLIGVPAAGQALYDIPAKGCAVHLLPIRMEIEADTSFGNFVRGLQSQVAEAVEHPAISHGALVRKLNARTELGRPPLVQAVFNYRAAFTGVEMDGVTVDAMENPRRHLFQELFLNLTAHADGAEFDAEYRTALLTKLRVETLLARMTDMMGKLVAHPEAKLGQFLPQGGTGESMARPAE